MSFKIDFNKQRSNVFSSFRKTEADSITLKLDQYSEYDKQYTIIMKLLAITNIVLLHIEISNYFECPFPMILTFYLQALIMIIIFFARVCDKPSKNHRVYFAFSKYAYYSFWMQMIYFGIFEIFKYTYSAKFYYGTIGQEDTDFKLALRFVGTLSLILYIYIISLMNMRICKAELDCMKKLLELPTYQ